MASYILYYLPVIPSGAGAELFAHSNGHAVVEDEQLVTDAARKEYQAYREHYSVAVADLFNSGAVAHVITTPLSRLGFVGQALSVRLRS